MQADDPQVQRLRAALGGLTEQDAAELLAEARIHARERVRQILTEAMVDSMLADVRRQVTKPARAGQVAKPARTAQVAEPARTAQVAEPARTAAPPPRRPRPTATAGELGWYVFGVVAADTAPAWTLPGIDRAQPVSTVPEGDLAAVVSRVALEDFGEARLREHLADMGWVEATARAHEEVLEQTRAQVTVIPMRMCSVYRTEEGVREMLRREAGSLTEALAHLHGKTEMGVKVFADRERVSAGESEPEANTDGPSAGAAYMERRRRERDRAEEAAQQLEQAAGEIHERLQSLAADAHVTPPQRPEATGHRSEMILNGVYLVDDDALDGFAAEVSELQEAFAPSGLELQVTGPWPAYNFVPGTIGAAW